MAVHEVLADSAEGGQGVDVGQVVDAADVAKTQGCFQKVGDGRLQLHKDKPMRQAQNVQQVFFLKTRHQHHDCVKDNMHEED